MNSLFIVIFKLDVATAASYKLPKSIKKITSKKTIPSFEL